MPVVQPPAEETVEVCDEARRVLRNRYSEAVKAGLSTVEAELFRDSDADIGHLRKLVAGRCSVELLREILL